ncbi:hypothetical protein AG4045_027439 [Apium graveolens]|uniref:Replication protein A OB domain-containing protein n=1 Tax=Apium graveolens TaxID=4045 RepID=A0A6L5B779_APIGR|nr:hypothetical protein AG4045_027439 [Apium graveolens]
MDGNCSGLISMEGDYVYLIDLEITLTEQWTIMVRVARKWPNNNVLGELRGFYLILIDECKHIVVTNGTSVTPLPDAWGLIPHDVCYFTNLQDIETIEPKDSYLIDVAGIVENVRVIQNVTNKRGEQQTYIDFTISDFSYEVRVRLWDELAHSFEILYYDCTEYPVIIIIHSSRMLRNDYNGVCSLTSMLATSFDFNSNCAKVDNLRKRQTTKVTLFDKFALEVDQRFSKATGRDVIGTRISASFRWGDEMETPVMTVMQIKSLQLKDIEEQVNCEIVVTKVVNRNKCFNIKTECSDGSGSIEVMFSDEDVCRIIGKKVDDIYCPQAEAKGEQFFPDILNQLVRQKYVITLSITKHNIENSSTVYDATNVGECIESIGVR